MDVGLGVCCLPFYFLKWSLLFANLCYRDGIFTHGDDDDDDDDGDGDDGNKHNSTGSLLRKSFQVVEF